MSEVWAQRKKAILVWSTLFGMRSLLLVVLLNEHLTPDTAEYAHGHASWSSIGAAGAGYTLGLLGVQLYGILGATFLGALVGAFSPKWWLTAILFVSPPGWYTVQASADAMGAAAALLAYRLSGSRRERLWAVPAVSAFHLVAGMGLAVSAFANSGWRGRLAAALLAGGLACAIETHLQVRYWLPGLSIAIGG